MINYFDSEGEDCPNCGETYPSWEQMLEHYKHEHSELREGWSSNKNSFNCAGCGKRVFMSRSDYLSNGLCSVCGNLTTMGGSNA